MDNLENKILFGKLKLKNGKQQITKNDCVFNINDKFYKNQEIIEIVTYKIIGTKNLTKDFIEVKANKEIRNKITGAYE
jgi:hypothetical protein